MWRVLLREGAGWPSHFRCEALTSQTPGVTRPVNTGVGALFLVIVTDSIITFVVTYMHEVSQVVIVSVTDFLDSMKNRYL